ncbi:MAG: hypothetical protein A2X36_01980 [Elusimicrobia bacterium GWA2_69_24]|nr:MAG: hypothetical protein A2X36_01980 [Elusimicrobia bacterium GWA2_69_24]HBL16500.1 hypothetical protein [Elusimicrobiota bacterium]
MRAILAALALLTLLAALPGGPAGPFDARSGAPVEGFRLEFSRSAALFEPFLAVGHALGGAPDHRAAILSSLVWLVLLTAAFGYFRSRGGRRSRGRSGPAAGGAALGAAVCFAGYVLLLLLARPPSWRLVSDSGDYLLADLQSHTYASHDGIVSPGENLRLHADHGYDVVAVTEHEDSFGAHIAEEFSALDPDLPAVVPGVELREQGGGYLLGLGAHLRREWITPQGLRSAEKFCAFLHEKDRAGAVVALSWKLQPEDAARLADAGVDGFEIANYGHPALPEPVRDALLSVARERGRILAASSDWHGWGGSWRTWTAIRIPGARSLNRAQRAAAVVEALRTRRAEDIIPVTAGRLGTPSTLRAVFAPFAESFRYARELSLPRVMSWWLWLGALWGIAALLRRHGRVPSWTLGAAALGIGAVGLLLCGEGLIEARLLGAAASGFSLEIGVWACVAGVVLAAGSLAAFRRSAAPLEGTRR